MTDITTLQLGAAKVCESENTDIHSTTTGLILTLNCKTGNIETLIIVLD